MSDLFLNPWAMAAGAALISAPIIIHLINRIRFRRVRWAAMEFLLKAQRRMRRKLILQQLLLLLLRITLVLLLGLLLGRFLGFDMAAQEHRSTAHVVILDDTPSMADGWRSEEGLATDAFEQAKKTLTDQVAKATAEATTPQTLEVVRLSDLAAPRPFGRVNTQSIEEMRTYLGGFKPSPVRVSLADGLAKAKELLNSQSGDVSKVVHVLSDFRAVDWTEEGDAIKQVMAELKNAGVQVHLIDVAHPYRKKDDRRSPLAHDNVAITELLPAKLVVARYEPVEFTLRVRNNGTSELNNVRFSIRVNGDEHKGGRSVSIPSLPGNQERAVKFELTFDRVGSEEKPLDRFSLVTASLESGEPGGLAADNVRHAVVEVRERLPILVVDEGPRDEKTADGFYLRPVFTSVLGGFGWVDGSPRDLETADLSRYSFVLVLNIATFSEAAVKNLEQYVKGGGGVGFFLGDKINPKEYNQLLYKDGTGLLPAPLADQPSRELSEDELQARRFRISQKKLLLRDPTRRNHPALAGLYTDERGEPVKDAEQLERVFGFISIKRYWPVQRIGKWRQDRAVTELYCMPNEQEMKDFEVPVRSVSDKLPVDDPEFAKSRDVLLRFRDELRRLAASSDPLYKLAVTLDDLLADQRGSGDPTEAQLREFWSHSKMADLRAETIRLRDAVKFGDPFYLAKEYGRGRVTLITTTAGEAWTDWPTERPGSASYTPIIQQMGNYLSGAGADENRHVGVPVELRFDAGRYKEAGTWAFLTHDPTTPAGGKGDPAPRTDPKELALVSEGERSLLRFREANQPGAYLFTVVNLRAQGSNPNETTEAPEYRGVAVNLDAGREGDLKRAARDDILQLAPGAELHSADDTDWLAKLRNKRSDFSETVLFFAILLLLLLLEQAMSVALSYHTAPGEVESAAPSAAAVLRKTSTASREGAGAAV